MSFFKDNLEFLGLKIFKSSISPVFTKIKAVKKMKTLRIYKILMFLRKRISDNEINTLLQIL